MTVEEWQCVRITELPLIRRAPISAIFSFESSRFSRNLAEAPETILASFAVFFSVLLSTWLTIHRMAFLMRGSVSLEADKLFLASESSFRNWVLLWVLVRIADASIAFIAAMATFLAPWISSLLIFSAVSLTDCDRILTYR